MSSSLASAYCDRCGALVALAALARHQRSDACALEEIRDALDRNGYTRIPSEHARKILASVGIDGRLALTVRYRETTTTLYLDGWTSKRAAEIAADTRQSPDARRSALRAYVLETGGLVERMVGT